MEGLDIDESNWFSIESFKEDVPMLPKEYLYESVTEEWSKEKPMMKLIKF